jgi:cyclase
MLFFQSSPLSITSSPGFVMKKIKHDMFLGAAGHLFEMARKLRRQETEAEKFLWSKLCNNQLGVKFRRQHPLYDYVVDFYCHSHGLVIEVDGPVHDNNEAKFDDSVRSKAFEEFNIEVMRFTNDEVLLGIEEVIGRIKCYLDNYYKL